MRHWLLLTPMFVVPPDALAVIWLMIGAAPPFSMPALKDVAPDALVVSWVAFEVDWKKNTPELRKPPDALVVTWFKVGEALEINTPKLLFEPPEAMAVTRSMRGVASVVS